MTARFAPATQPAVSAVLVSWGGLDWARKALDALARHTPEPFEAIVVDNASPDGLADALEAEYEGLRVIRNAENVGFGPACNKGASEARAPLVAFVNTDALVHEGWLPPLVEALARPGVVAAAGKLLHEDGSLQEAGALVSRSGGTVGCGDGDDPDDPAYAFPRVVDYVSAACMVVDRAAFAGAGGFDSAYAPAYYEDSDLCFRLAAAGGRVVYEPRSTVTHCRYGSGTSELAHELSDRHRALFVSRFAAELADRPRELSGRSALAARDARAHPRVLLTVSELDPGTRALAAALGGLLPDGRITVHLPEAPGDAQGLLAAGVEVASGERAAWLEGRALHYDAVLAPAADAGLSDDLDTSQPGAPRALGLDVQSVAADECRLRAVLAEVGVVAR